MYVVTIEYTDRSERKITTSTWDETIKVLDALNWMKVVIVYRVDLL